MVIICFLNLVCKKPDSNNQSELPFLTADKKSISALALAGKDTLSVNSNTNWSVINLPSWANASTMNGAKGNTAVIIQFSANEATSERAGDIVIKSDENSVDLLTIHFTQAGSALFISVDKPTLNENPSGQIDSITVSSNCSWTLDPPSNETGIKPDKTSGVSGITKIHLTIAANNSDQLKTADLKINGQGGSATPINIHLTQDINYQFTGFKPLEAAEGDTIIIQGIFNSGPVVYLNNAPLKVVSTSSYQLKAVLPSGISSGFLTVKNNDKTFVSSVPLTITNNNNWTKISYSTLQGNEPHKYGVSFVFNNKIYYGLGIDATGSNYSYNFDVYDPQTNLWSANVTIPSAMHPRSYASCFVTNNIVYIGLGAYNNTSDWWSYDPSKTGDNAWKQITPFYKNYFGSIAFTVNNTGYAGIPYKDGSLYQLDPSKYNGLGEWIKVNGLTFPAVLYSSQFVIKNKAYIIGGQIPSGDSTSACWEFDPVAFTLKPMANAPAKFRFAPSFSLNNKGYILAVGNIYEFDPDQNVWNKIASSPVFSGVYNAAVINGEAYAWTLDGDVYKLKL